MLSLPAIHRGQHPSPQTPLKEVNAHDRTNLLHRGHIPPPQYHKTKGNAHGELQEWTKEQTRNKPETGQGTGNANKLPSTMIDGHQPQHNITASDRQ